MNLKQKMSGLNPLKKGYLWHQKLERQSSLPLDSELDFYQQPKHLLKKMLPIVDKPTIQFIVEEALKSGIEDILVVTGKSKRSIEDHFDSNFELEYNLKEKGKQIFWS